MSKPLSRTALELCRPVVTPRLPPTYLLPVRTRCIATTTTTTTTSSSPTLDAPLRHKAHPSRHVRSSLPSQKTSTSIHEQVNAAAAAALAESSPSSPALVQATSRGNETIAYTPKAKPPSRTAPSIAPPLPTTPIPQSVKDALPLLRAQPGHYITFHIHGRPYLATVGDTVRLPFQMPGVVPGDVLRLNRASVLGSRDFTIKPGHMTQKPRSNEPAYIDERLYVLRAVVTGVESEPMREMEKTKRRNRKVKTVRSKHKYTVLRVSELKISDPRDL